MLKTKTWPHLSNATDDMLLNWARVSVLKKMHTLEEMRKLWGLGLSKKKRKILSEMRGHR